MFKCSLNFVKQTVKKVASNVKQLVVAGAIGVGAVGMAAHAHAADPVLDYTAVGTSITGQITPAITAAMPILGIILGITVGLKIYKKFAK